MTSDSLSILNKLIPYRNTATVTCNSDKLATAVLQKFFGVDWLSRYVYSGKYSSFLSVDGDSSEEAAKQEMRRILLAEMLYNLQDRKGFSSVWLEMSGGQIESTYAVLDIARTIYAKATDRQLLLKFVIPNRKTGIRSADMLLVLSDGTKLYAEAKCKYSTTKASLKTIEKTLSDAKDQLLSRRLPGAVFLKIPKVWTDDIEFSQNIVKLVARSAVRSNWVVAINLFLSEVFLNHDQYGPSVVEVMGMNETQNLNHKFRRYRGRDWSMFNEPGTAPSPGMKYNGMPETWQRLIWPVTVNPNIQPPKSTTKRKLSYA